MPRIFFIACAVVLVAVIAALILLFNFVDLGLSGNGIAAVFIGAILSVLLSMLLMGLVFASNRSGHDAVVDGRGPSQRSDAEQPRG
jgi:hypothetical protein